MLLFRARLPDSWAEKVLANLPAVLVDHAHLERKAATSALTLGRYHVLSDRVMDLTSIAIEELQHFQRVLTLLAGRGIVLGPPQSSPWISGLMNRIRRGQRHQPIDHLICAALIEGRSCEKFQILNRTLQGKDQELSDFYGSLVESEGNHYATYLLMARALDSDETEERLDYFLDLDAELIRQEHPHFILH